MKLKRVRVENIRSYIDLDISFDDGVTVVSGVNGSGKSSLLEACFTGLFGSRALSKDFVISDIIRKGATKASIVVDFENQGNYYSIEQGYKVDARSGKASNNRSVFKVNDEVMVDQANQTYEAVKALLKMDEEAYTNCVYIRQGEIDVLINAKTKDRQRMIDGLLQIGKLEEYRERASSARVGVGRHQREADSRLKDNIADIEVLEDSKPYQLLNGLRTEVTGIEKAILDLGSKKERAKELIESIGDRIGKYSEILEQKKKADSEIKDFKTNISKEHANIESSRDQVNSGNNDILALHSSNVSLFGVVEVADGSDIEGCVTDLEKQEVSARDGFSGVVKKRELALNNEAAQNNFLLNLNKQLNNSVGSIRIRNEKVVFAKNDLKKYLEDVEQIGSFIQNKYGDAKELGFVEDKLDQIDDISGFVNEKQTKLHGKEKEISATVVELEKKIQKSKDLLSKGLCPTCGQDLQGSKVCEENAGDEDRKTELINELELIRADQDKIKVKVELIRNVRDIIKAIAEAEKLLLLKKNEITSIEKGIEEHLSSIKEENDKVIDIEKQIDECKRSIGELKSGMESLKSEETAAQEFHGKLLHKLEVARQIRSNILKARNIQNNINRLQDGVKNGLEKIELFESQINERKQRILKLDEALGGVDLKELQADMSQYERAYNGIVSEMGMRDMRKGELHKEIGRIEGNIQRLNELKIKQKMLVNKKDFLAAVYGDAEELETMYLRLRVELRAKNIDALDRLLNEIFSFMYTNNAYSHISLDPEYNLTIYEKDGTPLEPKLLSGGERAIFNLVLRCAIYRLLAHAPGSTGSAELPPLIFDEPTVFLDRGHVHQLIKLIDMMRGIGVGQILIVSHDESLIDSADHVFVVEKDPITNSSSISGK
ncbi:AAA family ATPase [Methanococcoides burtonii]|uniref:DNA double-strand break repair Rad50 ATPase n=1 Tax=Methanococcoides burtonii (strain DSM 6242 / NBRC 107633 / OCM 468 / ACE-M) TaxID=259564 RepID=Q12VW8_METBU|nr:AAA family ATPase [Methanococcoides burtonii]ABE52408.1 DNA-binding Structural Maintenance of Chromosomes Protein with ATPase domain [Methanococcoides burtonii DSM 6242]